MKLKIDGEYADVDFWSFTKCYILSNLAVLGIVYGVMFLLGLIIGLSSGY